VKIRCLIQLELGLVGELGTGWPACASRDRNGNGPCKVACLCCVACSKRYIDERLRERTRN
jgi:hypothetical protein